VLVYRMLDRARRNGAAAQAIGWGPDRGFDQFISGIVRLSVASPASSSPAGSIST
jgi:multicomponent Na+:H+ antiporter subunit A